MIELRLWYDHEGVFDTKIPAPAVELKLKTALKILVQRARDGEPPFTGRIAAFEVQMTCLRRQNARSFPEDLDLGPEELVPDEVAITMFARSEPFPGVETWEIE